MINNEYIKKVWDWSDPKVPDLLSKLSCNGITLDELAVYVGTTREDIDQQFEANPMLRMAYDAGPLYAEALINNTLFDKATAGDLGAIAAWTQRKTVTPSSVQSELSNLLDLIDKAKDSEEMSVILRKAVYKRLTEDLMMGKIKDSSLLKLASMVSDRADGKVADKVDVSGVIGLKEILAEVSGKTAGLPKPEWFDEMEQMGYIDKAGALTVEVTDGKGK